MSDLGSPPSAGLAVLIERVQAATGPDRRLDFDVWWTFADKEPWWGHTGMIAQRPLFTEADLQEAVWRQRREYDYVSRYTASLDAVVALVERELPDLDPMVWRCGKTWYAQLSELVIGGRRHGSTAPLALLLAFLRAKAGLPQ